MNYVHHFVAFPKRDFDIDYATIITKRDGSRAFFGKLCSIAAFTSDDRSFLVADLSQINRLSLTQHHRIESSECDIGHRIDDSLNIHYFGSAISEDADNRSFQQERGRLGPRALFVDPSRSHHYFVAFDTYVRVSNGFQLSALAGRRASGCSDGHGSDAAFGLITDCVCTSDGKTLFLTDLGNRSLRSVHTETGLVRTIVPHWKHDPSAPVPHWKHDPTSAGEIGSLRKLAFYRSPTVKPDSILFITSDELGILRLDIKTNTLSRILGAKTDENSIFPGGIDCTASGTIIFSCNLTDGLYAVDPMTEVVEFLGRVPDNDHNFADVRAESKCTARALVSDFCIDDEDQSVWLLQNASFVDTDGFAFDRSRISRISVPPQLFWLSSV